MRNASEIYNDLQNLLDEVEQLEASGRVHMSTDSLNTSWKDTKGSFTSARTSLEVTIEAMCWMETTPSFTKQDDQKAAVTR